MTTTLPDARFKNFFALFDQPAQFQISLSDLQTRLHALQQAYHPDKATTESDKRLAETQSALINHAYQTLKAPDSRAGYLLEMVDQGANLDNSIVDLEFLDTAMDLRIDLQSAIDDKDSDRLQALSTQINALMDTHARAFESAYDQKNWHDAIESTQKLKFLQKLTEDVQAALHGAVLLGSDDDDLYV